jgi:hypothetical protein
VQPKFHASDGGVAGRLVRADIDREEGPTLKAGIPPRPWSAAVAACAAVFSVVASTPAPLGAAVVPPGHGVTFEQVDYAFDDAILAYSAVGRLTVEVAALRAATGIVTGFVNVGTPLGWVVQNLPVFAEYPLGALTTDFKLSEVQGLAVTSLAARVEFTPVPLLACTGGGLMTFPVGTTLVAEGGKEDEPAATSAAIPLPWPLPPEPGAVVFGALGDTFACCQDGHSNVEAARSQCGPAALANSLDWLGHEHPFFFHGLPVHRPGLGADGSLVGEIETRMGRSFTNRRRGRGVNDMPFVTGKLKFLEDFGLDWLLRVSHQDNTFGDDVVSGPGGRATSVGAGKVPTADFIIDEICAGEDVEIGWSSPGGHWEVGICAGRVLGVPFVTLLSDRNQADDTKGAGPDAARVSLLIDRDGDGLLNLVNKANRPEVDIVVTESPIPEIDELLWFDAWLTVQTGMVTEPILFSGAGTLVAYTAAVADRDADGRDEIPIDLAQLDLAGTSNSFGPVSLHLGAPAVAALSPTLSSWLEERVNATPGVLDLPPFAAGGTADLHLAVPAAVTLGGATWFSAVPLAMSGVVSFKPAAPGEHLGLESPVQLVNLSYQPMGSITSATFTPRPHLPATVGLTLNRTRFRRNETLLASLHSANPGPAFAADLLLAIEFPDGGVLVVTNVAPPGAFMTTGDDARRLLPLLADTPYPTGHSAFAPNCVAYRFTGAEPPGDYVLRAALLVPGSLHDGSVDPPDVIALDEAPFVFSGASSVRRFLRAPR